MTFPTIPTAGAGRVLTATQANTTATRTFPDLSGLTKNSGDLLIAIAIAYQSSASANTVWSGWGGGFSEFNDASQTTNMAIGCAYKWSTGSETGTFTVTEAATITGHAVMILLSIPGAHASQVPTAQGFAVGTSSAADPGSNTPSWGADDTLWIAVGGSGETSTTGSYTGIASAPTNYTDFVATGITSDVIGGTEGAVAFRQLNAASENAGPFTVDTSNARSAALVIAVRPAPAGTDLTVAASTQAQTADSPTLTQVHELGALGATQGQTAENVGLSQNHILILNAATQAVTSDNVTLSVVAGTDLVVQDAFHDMSTGPASLVVDLDVQAATHGHTADSPALVQQHALTVQAATQAQTSDSPALTQAHALAVQDATQAQTSEQPSLQVVLGVQAATQAVTSDSPTLTQVHALTVQDAAHAHTSTAPALVVDLAVQSATQAHTSSTPTLVQQHNLTVDSATHGHIAENVGLSSAGDLAPAAATHGHTVDSVALTQVHALTVADAAHTHTAGSVALTQQHILTVASSSHTQAVETPVFTQVHVLVVQDAGHAHTADNVAVDLNTIPFRDITVTGISEVTRPVAFGGSQRTVGLGDRQRQVTFHPLSFQAEFTDPERTVTFMEVMQ